MSSNKRKLELDPLPLDLQPPGDDLVVDDIPINRADVSLPGELLEDATPGSGDLSGTGPQRSGGKVSQEANSRCATVGNMAGREWHLRVLEADGKTVRADADTPTKFFERYAWERRGELLQSHGFSADVDEKSVPAAVLREADRILQTPLSLVEFVDEENIDRTFNAKGEVTGTAMRGSSDKERAAKRRRESTGGDAADTSRSTGTAEVAHVEGSPDPTPIFFEAGRRYIMVVASRPKLRELVDESKTYADGLLQGLQEELKTLRTEDECLEFFWQEWDDVLALLKEDGQPSLCGKKESQLVKKLCDEVGTPAFVGACVRADAWLCWEDKSCSAGDRSIEVGSLPKAVRTGLVSLKWDGWENESHVAIEEHEQKTQAGLRLAEVLTSENCKLTSLHLYDISDEVPKKIADALTSKNCKLTELVVKFGSDFNELVWEKLENGLTSENCKLTSLTLESCWDDADLGGHWEKPPSSRLESVLQSENCKLVFLNLDDNELTRSTVHQLRRVARRHRPQLKFKHCGLDSSDSEHDPRNPLYGDQVWGTEVYYYGSDSD